MTSNSPQHHPRNSSFLTKLCPCCYFDPSPSNHQKPQASSSKNPLNLIKEPFLLPNENPIMGLKPRLKSNIRHSSKNKASNLFKKTLCNCEFLKELNKNNEMFYIENISHYDKLLSSKKINPEKKKRLSENFKVLNILNKYPKNRVFLLKYNSSGLLCKITYKNFKFPIAKKKVRPGTKSLMVNKKPNPNTPDSNIGQLLQATDEIKPIEEVDDKLNLFSKYHQGIKIDSDSFEKILPEKVSSYLAKKFKKNSLIIDGISGVGGNHIQFALEGHNIIAFEMNEQRVNFSLNNAIIYGVRDKIDVIKGNFQNFKCKNKRIDLIFLAMEYENVKNPNENFCLFANILPDIRKTIENAMSITENIVLILPKYVDISELALLFTDLYMQKPQSFSVEIECLAFNNKIEKYAIYLGDQKSISPSEEIECLINYFNNDNLHMDFKLSETGVFINHVIEKIGIFEACQNLIEIESSSTDVERELSHKNNTLFQVFLERLLRDNLLSKEEISDYLNTEKVKDFLLKKGGKNGSESKEATYTFNPFKFQSLEKSNISAKSYKNELIGSPFNSIDLRDDNLTKKQFAKISVGENNFNEKENIFYSLDNEYIMIKKPENNTNLNNTVNNINHISDDSSNISNLHTQNDHDHTSMYSDLNLDISSDNSKIDENDVVDIKKNISPRCIAKKTIF